MDEKRAPDLTFVGSIAEVYERVLVPMIFESAATEMATRLAPLQEGQLLEIAAGTGAVTRALATRLPSSVEITATDLNQPMLDQAQAIGTSRPVTWQHADAMALPFDDGSFDVVVCQFGVMFFPDRPKAYAEIRRVLRPGGRFDFAVWSGLDENDFARIVEASVAQLFPDDPPRFIGRTPHGYHDPAMIQGDLVAGGFSLPATIDRFDARSVAESAAVVAAAYCHGTPMRNEIVSRDPNALQRATSHVEAAIEREHGSLGVDGAISSRFITVVAP